MCRGGAERAAALLDESLALARQAADQRGIALCLIPLLEQALGRFRNLKEKRGVGWALYLSGSASHAVGEYDRAKAFHLESLDIRRALGERRGIAECVSR